MKVGEMPRDAFARAIRFVSLSESESRWNILIPRAFGTVS